MSVAFREREAAEATFWHIRTAGLKAIIQTGRLTWILNVYSLSVTAPHGVPRLEMQSRDTPHAELQRSPSCPRRSHSNANIEGVCEQIIHHTACVEALDRGCANK